MAYRKLGYTVSTFGAPLKKATRPSMRDLRRAEQAQRDFEDYQRSATEADIQKAIEDWLGYHGWMVCTTSQPFAIVRGLVGLPDIVAFKDGVTLLIECKRRIGKLRKSQQHFALLIQPHLSSTLCYVVARSVEDVQHEVTRE